MAVTEHVIERATAPAVDAEPVEIVERKGLGHPDTLCDAVAEAIATALGRAYRQRTGAMAPMNVDKALLAAGASTPRFGGGTVDAPMHLVLGGRASAGPLGGLRAVEELAIGAARSWLGEHLRFVDPERHVRFQSELRPCSSELTHVLERGVARANDTSVGVGYAPFSRLERTVLDVERWLNGEVLRGRHPEVGEDIKVLGVRRGDALDLTLAIAFVDQLIGSQAHYFRRKQELSALVAERVQQSDLFASVQVHINTLDDPSRPDGMYLTVLGTSAEAGDDGQVGRGNRVNGFIAFNRPNSLEAAAGKNPVSHVGKIYNVLAHRIAAALVEEVPTVNEATVWLVSQIGRPIDEPMLARAALGISGERAFASVQDDADRVLAAELRHLDQLVAKLSDGAVPVY
ncbi:MAG: methionine adenosyltransferase [Deltaproteobacteria bacterium]|nr:methionine adenosyltransferase [Deltaproteobacteria bacterium]